MVSVTFQSFVCLGIVFLIWVICGFSITFGDPWLSLGGFHVIGNPFTFFMFEGVSVYEPFVREGEVISPNFPGAVYATYQGMFAVITPALISGSFQDRLQIGPYLIYLSFWLIFVYCPIGYWNWGGGWMKQIGAYDFAGGLVVHVSAGFASLACCAFLGRRQAPAGCVLLKVPHNVPFTLLGTAMLWLGWFGFNGGSALGSGGLAGIAFLNTQLAASSGMMTWVLIDWITQGKPKLMGACGGAICGMVVITPGAGYCQPGMAVLTGIIGSLFCYHMIILFERLGIDDAVDSSPVHGMGGFLGAILVGALADSSECADTHTAPKWCVNPGGATRSVQLVLIQTLCTVVSALWSFSFTYLILVLLNKMNIAPLLDTYEAQEKARDSWQHGEAAYAVSPTQVHAGHTPLDDANAFGNSDQLSAAQLELMASGSGSDDEETTTLTSGQKRKLCLWGSNGNREGDD
eukprot:TRINITY_DN62672_c0_g1_i1.p1 TRINITY_DN62672_c0_g1~~TRINITY_DN62672_c0_g1_i1.p1  ORF type:complete len:540 (+),score=59.54 TRINITY_DN62672_c0_g1_i1:238-1620(+)